MTQRLTVGDVAPNDWLQDKAGEAVSLAEFWAQGPILLTFLRHFG
jgi:peroxiredoxin